MGDEKRYLIGYALAPKKQQSFIRLSLINLAKEKGIDLVPIDTSRPLVEQGPFACILHKLSGTEWENQLQDCTSKYPNVCIIDSPKAVERLNNRISMLQVVSELKISQGMETFGTPNQIVVNNPKAFTDSETLLGLKFPVIAKPLVADGSAKSHKMSLVFNPNGLLKLKPPLVLQEFVNHGGVIFKIYVVGDYVKCVKRKSLPDVSDEKLHGSEGLLAFSQISNMSQDCEENYDEIMHLGDAVMPPLSFIEEIARAMRRAMGLNLFNFDVIRDVKLGNHYLVIDINYFPGYAKMPCYEAVLTDFFLEVCHQRLNAVPSSATEDKGSDSYDSLPGLNGEKLQKCRGESLSDADSSGGEDVNVSKPRQDNKRIQFNLEESHVVQWT
ncbi:inositol-tetrakisphosphate 1-kinase 5 [Amborella trichopoda]|uniref:Inositol-tetrakisphosphate 1-kinase n=1 Tax=Amborella trichopoda TaxID=13333 RepID=U5D561_AMBTC|nr:inositol-tetrakisphosphate 1-kinase 5 [Amborella trichopoda]XP_011626893.1 inositol-tetrakisphosphate 1-kinase 5 [Amborella trichopoda]XP_020529093.1 inositol-tetrakisphosphate 1-kinase 5 [Amborella trichopoda]ERN15498.1 hypothetical protein AMTR_s00048p00050940 [Amborella trichopoda]|eukprot:XP_006854031.1 inositol-tetrakisphosphate 1-kinase 5 [Amborella trichopoda]